MEFSKKMFVWLFHFIWKSIFYFFIFIFLSWLIFNLTLAEMVSKAKDTFPKRLDQSKHSFSLLKNWITKDTGDKINEELFKSTNIELQINEPISNTAPTPSATIPENIALPLVIENPKAGLETEVQTFIAPSDVPSPPEKSSEDQTLLIPLEPSVETPVVQLQEVVVEEINPNSEELQPFPSELPAIEKELPPEAQPLIPLSTEEAQAVPPEISNTEIQPLVQENILLENTSQY